MRTSLGLSQVEFARALGVAFTTVNRWENGKAQPQNDRLVRIQERAAKPVIGFGIKEAEPE